MLDKGFHEMCNSSKSNFKAYYNDFIKGFILFF